MTLDGDSFVEFRVGVGSPYNLAGMNSLLVRDGSHAQVDTSGDLVKAGVTSNEIGTLAAGFVSAADVVGDEVELVRVPGPLGLGEALGFQAEVDPALVGTVDGAQQACVVEDDGGTSEVSLEGGVLGAMKGR